MNIHIEAAKYVTELAESLLTQAHSDPPPDIPPRMDYHPDLPIDTTIGEQDVTGPLIQTQSDRFGVEISRIWADSTGLFSLTGPAHAEFMKISSTLHRQPDVRTQVSQETVREIVFEWMCRKHRGETELPLVPHFLAVCPSLIEEWEVIIPLHGVHVQSPFQLGNVTLADLSSEQMRAWRVEALQAAPDHAEGVNHIHDGLRKNYQGRAAAIIRLRAEREHAVNRAFEEAELSVAVLRLFSVGAFAPERPTLVALAGREHVPYKRYIVRGASKGIVPTDGFLYEDDLRAWTISRELVQKELGGFLGHWSLLLRASQRTPFQDTALKSMLLYSGATTYRNISEKLIHIFSAIESLLLRNDTEPIVAAAADRLAFAVGTDATQRSQIAKDLRLVYGMRSRYVHHAIVAAPESDDLETLQSFLVAVSQLFVNLRAPLAKFRTKDEFINELEARKFS